MKKIHYIFVVLVATFVVTSCGEDYRRNPGKAYAPDMTYSRAYDYYNGTDSVLNIGLEKGTVRFNKMPVKNTIAREQTLPTHVNEMDTVKGYGLQNPFELYASDLENGQRLYMIHCGICHGEKLDGQGPLYTSDKYAAAPANLMGPKYINFSAGKIRHAIVYGKNMMGSYASQLDPKQRWQVIAYIKSKQAESSGAAFSMISEKPVEEVVAEVTEDHHADGDHDHDAEGNHTEGEHHDEAH